MMAGLVQDLRYSVRMLLKYPAFTAVTVLALAIGIGANTAIFSVVNAVLLRPLPYPGANQLVKIWEKRAQLAKGRISFADFNDWKDQNQVFDKVAAYQIGDYNLTDGDEPEQLQGAAVSADLFSVLRVQPEFGRAFLPEEEQRKSNPVIIISRGLWQRRFGSAPDMIGRTINLDNKTYTVVGIMPGDFPFPGKHSDLWIPLTINPQSPMAGRGMHILEAVGRLKPGVSVAQAQAEMETIAGRLSKQYPGDNAGHGVNVLSLQEDSTGTFRTSLIIIFCVVGFVLLIACANVANLLLARAAVRQKEIALRTALGATRRRVVRQLLTESIMLSFLGGGLGLLLGQWGVKLLISLSSGNVPRIEESRLDGSVMIFTLLTTLATGILFGLAPALQLSRPNLNELLKEGGTGGSTNVSGNRLRNALVVAEVALSLILLVGSGLMLKSFVRLQNVNTGFNPDHVLTAKISLPGSKYRGNQRAVFLQQVMERVQASPQVIAAGAVTHLPLAGNGPTFNFEIEGRPPAPTGEEFKAQMRCATPDYFRALGIPFIEGRQFSLQDNAEAPGVVIISDVMARRYWPGQSPLGKLITLDKDEEGKPIWRQIVGVVQGVRHNGLEFEPEPQMYTPYAQFSMPFINLVVRTKSEPLSMAGDLRREVLAVDKEQPLADVRTMEQIVSESVAPRQFGMLLLSLFAGVALLLASIGIYGVISYSVTQRTREIGIRIALGANRWDVLRMIVGSGMGLALAGVAIGLFTSFALTRVMSSLLFQVSASDPATFLVVALLLTIVALFACYIPARRAMKIDPVIALRYE